MSGTTTRSLKLLKPKLLKGPARDGGRSSSPRYVAAIPAVAAYLDQDKNDRALRGEAARRHVDVDIEVPMTEAELLANPWVIPEDQKRYNPGLYSRNAYSWITS